MRRLGRGVSALAALGVTVLVAGCGGSSGERAVAMTCPRIVPASATDTIAVMRPGGHEMKDILVGGKILDASTTCKRVRDGGMDVFTEIHFYAKRADVRTPDTVLPYFVALLDPQQQVIAQEGFQLPVKFYPGEAERRFPAEDITINLPVKNVATGSAYTIVVGFQLTPDQLAFNRAARAQTP